MRKILLIILLIILIVVIGGLMMACGPKTAKGEKTLPEVPKYSFVGEEVEPFKVKDLDGKEWTNEIYSEYKMTMHVFWSPNCVPCIEELKALQKLKENEDKLGMKLLSFCVEGTESDIAELKKSYEMDYPIVMMKEDSIMESCTKDFEFIPFVIFVDQNGKYMKEFLVGSRTYEEYMTHIKSLGIL